MEAGAPVSIDRGSLYLLEGVGPWTHPMSLPCLLTALNPACVLGAFQKDEKLKCLHRRHICFRSWARGLSVNNIPVMRSEGNVRALTGQVVTHGSQTSDVAPF